MATLTYSFTEDNQSSNKASWVFNITGANVTATGATVSVAVPTVTAKMTGSGKTTASADLYYATLAVGSIESGKEYGWELLAVSWASGATKTLPIDTGTGFVNTPAVFNTSQLFTSANKAVRTVNVTFKPYYGRSLYFYGESWAGNSKWNCGSKYVSSALGTIATITLSAPPTFSETFSYVGDFSGVPYANMTTAKVKLSSLSAKYGGDFSGVGKAEFTIGSVTATKANPANGDVLSIALNAVGTFTPTVKVTDSRGQVTTHTLPAITVMGYTAPSVTFDVERTLPKTEVPTPIGKPDDEGESATITAKFTFTDAIATLSAPTVAVTDAEGVARTPTVTWYSTRASDGTLSGSVTWANLSSGDTVYGLVSITGDFNTQKSYQIAVTPQDSEDPGTTITQTLGSAFYTIDFLAGGHGIAFGEAIAESELYESVGGTSAPTFVINTYYETVTSDGITNYELLVSEPSDWLTDWTDYYIKVHDGLFKCNMDAYFADKADVMRALFDFIHPVGSYYETSDTSFNPNITWGGTWVLETEGLVHISAGTNYVVSGATTDTKDGGATTSATGDHTLTVTEIPSHNHGGSTGNAGAHSFSNSALGARTGATTLMTAGSGCSNWDTGATRYRISNNSNTASFNPTSDGISVGNHAHTVTAQGGGGAHNHGNVSTMQPYIIVNRWHRTA